MKITTGSMYLLRLDLIPGQKCGGAIYTKDLNNYRGDYIPIHVTFLDNKSKNYLHRITTVKGITLTASNEMFIARKGTKRAKVIEKLMKLIKLFEEIHYINNFFDRNLILHNQWRYDYLIVKKIYFNFIDQENKNGITNEGTIKSLNDIHKRFQKALI